MSELKDVFICHASEDKPEIIKPLVEAFKREGISFWYDEAEIKWGDSIIEKVNEGLRVSRYVIVVISKYFLSKNWPKRELNSALSIEASTGKVRVLPLVAGTDEVRSDIFQKYPILNDKSYLTWENNAQKIIDALNVRLGRTNKIFKDDNSVMVESNYDIPIPEIPREFSQLDKDRFTKNTFDVIKKYFNEALDKLKEQYSNLDSELVEISNFKFVCSIYQNGDLLNKCKIWIGGPLSEDTIAYCEGSVGYENDSSFNDWLAVKDDGFKLGLEASGFAMEISSDKENKLLSSEDAAKYLWVRFTNRLTFRR
jgi:hypothetical protein